MITFFRVSASLGLAVSLCGGTFSLPANADFRGNPGFGSATGNSQAGPGANVGASTGNTVLSPYYFQNRPGIGFYNAPVYAPGFPVYGAPVPVGGGYFGFKAGGVQYNFWKAPSGYYYPWCYGLYPYRPQVILFQQGAASPALPPVSTIFGDLRKYLDESRTGGKLNEVDYASLSRWLNDLQNKERSLRLKGGGILDQDDETDLRRDIDKLGEQVSRRVRI